MLKGGLSASLNPWSIAMPLLPFSHILCHPTKDLVVLSFGEHLQAVDTK
jgi:hypothetical protein